MRLISSAVPKVPLPAAPPDIDPLGIQDEDVGVHPAGTQGAAQGIEAEGIVGGNKDRGGGLGVTQGIQPRYNAVVTTPDSPARQIMVPGIFSGELAGGGEYFTFYERRD